MTPEQKKLLSLFIEIDDICERHDIVYYMAGGTLIGAMRHKGFIPWDDDMDLLMTRDNWLKFIEVTRYDIPENRVLECQELDRDYPNMFGRYTDITSSAIHKNQILGDGIAGYVVDILVLDPIPDKTESYVRYRDDLLLYSDLVNPSLNYSYRYQVNGDRYPVYSKKMKRLGKNEVLSEIEQRLFAYNEEACPYYVMRWGGAPFIFDKDMYGNSRFATFEGIKCRIPDRTGDYLTWHYGDDWMNIPHHSEHESHDAIFSFTTDYKTIQKDYLRYLDIKKVRKSIEHRKHYLLNHMDALSEVKDRQVRILSLATKLDIEYKVLNCGFDIFQALKEEKHEKLSVLFAKFFDEQLSRKQIGREDYLGIGRFNKPVYCGLDDGILYVAVMVLTHTNRIAKAARLIEVRETTGIPISSDLKDALSLILQIRKAISLYDLGKYAESFELTTTLLSNYHKNYNLNVLKIRHLMDRGAFDEAEESVDIAMAIFPRDGVFLKFYGDLVYRKDKDRAYKIYEKAVAMTTNGCTHLEVKEKVLADKSELIAKTMEKLDLESANRYFQLADDDLDFYILKQNISLNSIDSAEELFSQIQGIKKMLIHFDFDLKLLALLKMYYIKIGEKPKVADLRTKYLTANTVSDYHELAAELETYEEHEKDGTYYKLLGDVSSNLGLIDEANDFWSKARKLPIDDLTRIELKTTMLKES